MSIAMQFDLLAFIADDRQIVTYRPRWNEMTGSVTATILLQQIIYRWVQAGRRPFYKFTAPCDHPACRAGDSWQEELGLTRHEFEGARARLAVRTAGGEVAADALVSYWMTAGHFTWYAVNEAVLVERLTALYAAARPPGQCDFPATPLPDSANGKGQPLPESANGVCEKREQIYRDQHKDNEEQRFTERAAARPARAGDDPPAPPRGRPPAGPSALERQGYSPYPPTAAHRYPARPPLLAHVPLTLRAMGLDEAALRAMAAAPVETLYAPAHYHQGERGVPLGREEGLRLWMVAMLGIVCGVQLRTGRDETAADTLWPLACDLTAEGVTPPALWRAFADRAGYWHASEEHAWKRRRPTAAEVRAHWAVGLAWRAETAEATGRAGGGKYTPAELDAWARVVKAAGRYGRQSRVADWPELDDAERRAVIRLGFIDFMTRRADDELLWRARFIDALRRVRAETPAGDAPPPTPASLREPPPVYAAA